MSQLIWMIDLIPNFFWTLVLWAGVIALTASYLLGKIPFVAQYKIPLRVGGVIATLIGVYFYGVIANEAKWQARVTELEAKVKVAEEESTSVNKKLDDAIAENKKLAAQKTKEVVRVIDKWRTKEILKEVEGPERVRVEEVIKYIEQCPVPKEMIDIHNKGAEKPAKGDKK
jgi:uncharacterized membrane protein YheB (UPF0754 family)